MTRARPPAVAAVVVALVSGLAVLAAPRPAAAAPHTITWDRYSLMIDGQRTFVWSGEFHPFRLPSPSLWRDVLQKMKAQRLQRRLDLLRLGLPLADAGRLRLHRRARHGPAARTSPRRPDST